MRILLVEDATELVEALEKILVDNGHSVNSVNDGRAGYREAHNTDAYDVIVLDWMLPGMDGYEIIRLLRGEGVATPIIMVTARNSINDRVDGLNVGADDYLPKPFSPRELLARIDAIARRSTSNAPLDGKLRFGDLVFDLDTSLLSTPSDSVPLTPKEKDIVVMMMSNPEDTFSKERIMTTVWGDAQGVDVNNVEAYISFIRKKLEGIDSNVSIKTLRKVGYKLNVE